MSFNWRNFVAVANHLRKFSHREEYQRTAVGRYYYACYLIARDIYNDMNGRDEGTSIPHGKLISELSSSKNETIKSIGTILKSLFKYRKNADYDMKFNFDNFNQSKVQSDEFFDLIKKLK